MPQPHVLLFLCDQMQYQRQGMVDPLACTPHLARLAAEGVFFTHQYCANAQCVPSRASLQTGLYPHEAGVMIIYGFHGHTARLTGDHLTVGHVFREAGYTTAYFGKTHFGTPLATLGYDRGSERGARPPLSAGDRAIVDDALALLAEWLDAMAATSAVAVDPLRTVLLEGGPFHCRGRLPAYLERLRATGRAAHAERLAARHPTEA